MTTVVLLWASLFWWGIPYFPEGPAVHRPVDACGCRLTYGFRQCDPNRTTRACIAYAQWMPELHTSRWTLPAARVISSRPRDPVSPCRS